MSLRKLELLEKQAKMQRDLPHLYGLKFYPWQREFFESRNRINLLTAANQIGKALPLCTLIPTPSGFKTMGELKVGDEVFGQNGVPCRVTHIPYKGVRKCYRITFDDGVKIKASGKHLWKVQLERNRFRPFYTANRGKKKGKKIPNPSYGKWEVLSTEEIIEKCGYGKGKIRAGKKAALPICRPVEYKNKKLLVDPYKLGLMLGDGSFVKMSFGSGDIELTKTLVKDIKRDERRKGYTFGNVSSLRKPCRELGLEDKRSDVKFIPSCYLTSSKVQRLNLLRGLMDTDGSIYGKNTLEYCTVSTRLRDDFIELVNSLGGVLNKITTKNTYYYNDDRKKVKCKDAYSVRFRIEENPFKLKRKADKWRSKIRYRHQRLIESIEDVGEMETKCISVDSKDSTFLAGKEYVVTHNSSVAIRKAIHWATDKSLWKELWPAKILDTEYDHPGQFWYLYPDKKLATVEFKEKWVKEFLPRGDMKNHPVYGWKERMDRGEIQEIIFNSGVTIYFKTYMQNPASLQAGTVFALFCDEELPFSLYDELMFRLSGTDGYYHNVFTATLNQDEWRSAMEPSDGEIERLPHAWKRQISMYMCQKYEDGTDTPWTAKRIAQRVADCGSETEIKRRIYGKFVSEEGRKYCFEYNENTMETRKIPKDWEIYSGVDIGSGGSHGHPAAIIFVAVSPDYTEGEVFCGERMDGIPTTAGDILERYIRLKEPFKGQMIDQKYDYHSKDFFLLAERAGQNFSPANKKHTDGEEILNTLFRYQALNIHQDAFDLIKLCQELHSLKKNVDKRKAKDDYSDALRYAVVGIPWNMDRIKIKRQKVVKKPPSEIELRRSRMVDENQRRNDDLLEEINEWNSMYEGS